MKLYSRQARRRTVDVRKRAEIDLATFSLFCVLICSPIISLLESRAHIYFNEGI